MSQQDEIRYDRRTVKKWVQKAQKGEVALTDFQRSFVWTGRQNSELHQGHFFRKACWIVSYSSKGGSASV